MYTRIITSHFKKSNEKEKILIEIYKIIWLLKI
nr:MAG TPA: hypothetical protein [Caudoviricetes sp.]